MRVAVGIVAALLLSALPSAAQAPGGRVAFVADGAIHVAAPDGSGFRTLWSSGCAQPAPPSFPCATPSAIAWSPDGSRFAFTHEGRLFVANGDGSGVRLLAVRAALGREAWSPDGTRLAVVVGEERAQSGDTPADVYVVSAEGGAARRVTFHRRPKSPPGWSPINSTLVYSFQASSVPARAELATVDADDGGPPRELTVTGPGVAGNLAPTWSPDGEEIAFLRSIETAPTRLHLIRPDGTGLRQVTPAEAEDFAWSPDGTRIAFSTAANSSRVGGVWDRDLYTVGPDGSGLTRLTQSSERHIRDIQPSWSADGARIAFVSSNRRPSPTAESAAYTMNADGSCERRLTPPGLPSDALTHVNWPAWDPSSPPGRARCRDLLVTFDSQANPPTAEILNDGTEPLDGIVLTAEPGSGAILTSVSTDLGACVKQRAAFRCALTRLEPGARATITVNSQVRRVTTIRIGWMPIYVKLSARSAPADDEDENNAFDLDVTEGHCTTALPGGGEVRGTPFPDWLCGRRGKDRLVGRGGRDLLQGGGGADSLEGGIDRDLIEGGPGPDRIYAEDGEKDEVHCGPGRDRVEADRVDFVLRNCERVKRL